MVQPAIDISRVSKTFRSGRKALDGVTLRIAPGEMVALIGASGSGKSTLLRHIAGLAVADRGIEAGGYIAIDGVRIQGEGRVSAKVRDVRTGLGFVFQQFNLVGRLSVLTNVMTGGLGRIPIYRSLIGWFTPDEREKAFQSLARVGIPECALQRASTLSGGQQQRAAIARALVQGARTILADEPIASLDPESSRRVMEILRTINQEDGTTVVVSLHQVDHAVRYCPRTIALKQGVVMFDGPSNTLTPAILTDIYGAELDWQDPSHQAAAVGDRSADAAGLAAQLA